MILILVIILVALAFEYVNGFHDTANSIATVVSTKVLLPLQAVILAAVFNFLGALAGTAVATTIGRGLVEVEAVTLPALLCALLSGIIWNLITWKYGLPSSSSHALIGGLCGAGLAVAHGDWSVIRWAVMNPETGHLEGVMPKVVIPMFMAPVFGVVGGFALLGLLFVLFNRWTPSRSNVVFGRLQLISSAAMSFGHGTNDAQKTMGIIALVLFTGTQQGCFNHLPQWAHFLYTPKFEVHVWVKTICALTMAAGTAAGGWRIIRTVGSRVARLQKIHGFAAQSAAAVVIQIASHWGMPLSTTHVITSSILGTGATKGIKGVRWGVVERMVWAWVMTLPITIAMGYLLLQTVRFFNLH